MNVEFPAYCQNQGNRSKCILWSFCCLWLDSSHFAHVSESMYWTHKTLCIWLSFLPGGSKSTCLLCQTMHLLFTKWRGDLFFAPARLWMSRYLQEIFLSLQVKGYVLLTLYVKLLSFWACSSNTCVTAGTGCHDVQ